MPFPPPFLQLLPWPPPSFPPPEHNSGPALLPHPHPGVGLQLPPPSLSSSLNSLPLLSLLQ